MTRRLEVTGYKKFAYSNTSIYKNGNCEHIAEQSGIYPSPLKILLC